MKKKMRGSFAVEASILVPLILWIFVICIWVLFYYHDKNLLITAANECVVTEGEEEIFKDMVRGRLMLFEDLDVCIEERKEEVELSCVAKRGKVKLVVKRKMLKTIPEHYIRRRD